MTKREGKPTTKTPRTRVGQNWEIHRLGMNTEATFWISKILHLGVMVTEEADSNDAFDEFINDVDEHSIEGMKDRLDLTHLWEGEEDNDDDARDALCRAVIDQERYGFLCYVQAPEVIRRGEGAEVHLGITHCRWFYDEDLAGILKQADAWAKSLEKVDASRPRGIR